MNAKQAWPCAKGIERQKAAGLGRHCEGPFSTADLWGLTLRERNKVPCSATAVPN